MWLVKVHHIPEPKTDWDFWMPILNIVFALLLIYSLSGCGQIRRDQIEKDRIIIDRNLSNFQWSMRNEFDRNQVRNLRAKVNKELTEQ